MRIVPRAEVCPTAWDAFVYGAQGGWCWHLSAWLDYLAAAGRKDESYALMDASGLTAICPVLLPVPLIDPLPCPLGMSWDGLAWPVRGQPIREQPAHGFQTRVIDLSLSFDALWTGLRRSSHALIHRAEEQYAVRPASNVHGLRSLYHQRADLPQINPAQWACLSRLLHQHVLRIYEASDGLGDLVGAAAIYVYKGWAYYGHGRSVGGHGVSHLLQWAAIQALKLEGVPWYEVGWCARPGDDEKAQQIAFFKQGFGGDLWWVPVW